MNGFAIPYGFVGTYVPPVEAGVLNSKSPVMNVPAVGFWDPTTKQNAFPQFVTDKGQQIGSEFFPFGTYVGPPNAKSGSAGCGFLSDPFDQGKDYGKPNIFDMSVTSVDGWKPIVGQPLWALTAPKTAGQSKAAIGAQINELVSTLVNMP